jgi:hypothetical protein
MFSGAWAMDVGASLLPGPLATGAGASEIFLPQSHPGQFVVFIVFFRITCAFVHRISHCPTVGDFAQKQKLKPGALRLKRKKKHEKSTHNKQTNTSARPIRVGFGGSHDAGDRSFVIVGPGSPAVVTALWLQLPGMVGQMVAVVSGAEH